MPAIQQTSNKDARAKLVLTSSQPLRGPRPSPAGDRHARVARLDHQQLKIISGRG